MKWKMSIVLLVAAALVIAAAAVGSAQVTVTYWTFAPQLTEELVPLFEEMNPDIKIEVVPMDFADLHDKLLVSLIGGSPPDLAMVEIQHIGRVVFRAGDFLQDLSRPPFDADRYKDDFVPYKWEQGVSRGRLVAFPWDIAPAALFYRRSLFEEAGFSSDPESMYDALLTWDDYIEAGKKLYLDRNNDGVPERFIIGDARALSRIAISQTGLPLIDPEHNVNLGHASMMDAVDVGRRAREAMIDGIARVQWQWSDEWYQSFASREAATEIMGSWFEGTLKDVAPDSVGDWGVIPIPSGVGVNQGGSFLVIPAASENKEAAWKFIEFVAATAEGQNHIYSKHGSFPAYKPAWEDPLYDEPVDFFAGQPARRMFARISEMIPYVYTHPLDNDAWDILNDVEKNNWRGYISRIVDGEIHSSALTEAARELSAIVAEWRAEHGL